MKHVEKIAIFAVVNNFTNDMTYIEIDKLKPHKGNPRRISSKELDKLGKSIKNNPDYFEARPIICDINYTIYAGNSRYKAAQKIGMQKVPVHVMNLPEAKMREIMIRDNVNNGEWDVNILADEFDFDILTDFGLELTGNWGTDEEENAEKTAEKTSSKKAKAKTTIICPNCNKEVEI